MSIMLDLTVEEVNQLLNVLGEQPIKSGLSALTSKIKNQGDEQLRISGGADAPAVVV